MSKQKMLEIFSTDTFPRNIGNVKITKSSDKTRDKTQDYVDGRESLGR